MRCLFSHRAIVMGLLTCFSVAAVAAVTVPPPETVSTEAGVFSNDARLTQKVRLRVEGLPVKELLALLSRQTGVECVAQEDIGEEKVVFFQPARSLQATLTDLAALFNNRWQRVEQPRQPPHYRLLRSPRAREYEDSLANGPARRYMAQMHEMIEALGETPEQFAQRSEKDPVRACLLNRERRLATQFYASLSEPQQLQLFEDGATDARPFSSLEPAQQEALLQWREALAAKMQNPGTGTPDGGLDGLSGISGSLSKGELTKETLRFVLPGGPAQATASVRLQIGDSGFLMLRTLYDRSKRALAAHGNPYTGKAVTAIPATVTVEALGKAARQAHWIDRLRSLSETNRIPVLSDYFRADTNKIADEVPMTTGNGMVAEMDRFCQPYRHLWWVGGQALLLRSASWPTLRDYEVPDRWILDTSRQIHAHQDAPTFGDLYAVLELTPRQIVGLERMYGYPITSGFGSPKSLNTRPFLELVRACLPDESQALPRVKANKRGGRQSYYLCQHARFGARLPACCSQPDSARVTC